MSSVAVDVVAPTKSSRSWTIRGGKDSPRSWIVCVACFWCTLCYFPFYRTANIIYSVLARDHGFSRKVAYDMFGTLIVCSCVAGVIVSYLTRWISCRVMVSISIVLSAGALAIPYFGIAPESVLILGGLYGVGRGTLNNQFPVILSRHFDKHRTKSVGIQRAGMCISGFAFSIMVPWLIDHLGLRGTFLALAVVMLNALFVVVFLTDPEEPPTSASKAVYEKEAEATALVRDNANGNGRIQLAPSICSITNEKGELNRRWSHISQRSRKSSIASQVLEAAADPMEILAATSLAGGGNERDKEMSEINELEMLDEDTSTRALLRHVMLYVLFMNTFSLYLQFNVFMVLMDVAQDSGVSSHDASMLNLVFSVGEIVAYLSVGFITREKRKRTRSLLITCQVVGSVIPLFYSISTTIMHFAVLTALSAYATGAILLLNVILMRQYLGEAYFARALGLTQITGILSYFVISPLIRYYRDIHQSYVPALRIISGLCFVCNLFWFLEIVHNRQQRRQGQRKDNNKIKRLSTDC